MSAHNDTPTKRIARYNTMLEEAMGRVSLDLTTAYVESLSKGIIKVANELRESYGLPKVR